MTRPTILTPIGWLRTGIDWSVLTILLTLGVLGFGPTFGGDPRYLLAGVGGVLLGLGVAWLAARRAFGPWAVAGSVLAVYLLAGHALAAPVESFLGFLPTLESLRVLIVGVVFSWKDLLTVADPVGVARGMLVVPFLTSLVAAVGAGCLAWRVRSPYWVLLPVAGLFMVSIAFGTNTASLPALRGTLLVAILVAWLAYRRDIARSVETTGVSANPAVADAAVARAGRLRRLGLGAAVVAAATVLTVVLAPLTANVGGGDRQVLRDVVEPPVDLFDYPSPLTSFRKYVKDNAEDTLFTVEGLPENQRVRLAAVDAYDGVVYNVNPQAAGNFSRVGDARRLGTAGNDDDGTPAQLTFTMEGYRGVWLPSGGALQGVNLQGPRAQELGRSLYYSDEAQTALSTIGVQEGDTYQVNVLFPEVSPDTQLAQYDFADLSLPRVLNDPPVVAAKASEYVGAVSEPIERVRRLEQVLSSQGFFSNGKEDEAVSLPGHGAARMLSLLDSEEMVGDDEQYAVAMALMARKLNIPARVVMGFYPDWDEVEDPTAPLAITGSDVHAWVEIAFDNEGWVAFDPTPPEDNEPVPPQQQPRSTPKPQVLQPPPPPQEPAELPPNAAPEPQDAEEREDDEQTLWGWVLTAVAIALIPVAILLLPLLVIALLKARRRKKRAWDGAPSERVGGGWNEVLSVATDLGARINPKATRRETARGLTVSFPASSRSTTVLAERADAGIFSAGQPPEEEVRDYWQDVATTVGDLQGSVGFWKRQRAKYSLRSLRQDRKNAKLRRRTAATGKSRE